MEVLRPVPKQPLGILLTKGTVPLKDNTTPSTPAGLLLFPGQEGNPLLLQLGQNFIYVTVFRICIFGARRRSGRSSYNLKSISAFLLR
ncbi:hypothetical protein Taro_021153 [Colocasia esculenta]|uniref:Uncharacterized protein n=1 Tax=Colocasia esculenta TaxID=4460 RepID=A0A843V1M7_COLES|nr:hypothetical protein [Colocasia esculenta]